MKILARRSVTLSMLALIVGFFYAEPQVGEAFSLANNSPDRINRKKQQTPAFKETSENITYNTSEAFADVTEKKAVKSTSISKAASYKATAYCLKGRTASGSGVRRGIVAADPRVLPLGTRIQITAGSYSGTYTVTDTGGAIRGRILDLWVPNCSEAIRFGRKNISVSVLGR
jgi:3D (Asp-Asp-Asp) domain-containing protein